MPRVLITRPTHQASALADVLSGLGCEPIVIPTIDLAPPTSFAALDAALSHLDRFDWLIFTSANAVAAFAERLRVAGASSLANDGRANESRPRIAAIGAATARALHVIGVPADLVPPSAVAESLSAALLAHVRQPDNTPTQFLLVRAETAREYMPEALRSAGAEVTIAPAYRTVLAGQSADALRHLISDPARRPHAVTFTSSSAVTSLLALLESAGLQLPPSLVRVSIGPITSATLMEAGLPPHVEAPQATIESLAYAVLRALQPAE